MTYRAIRALGGLPNRGQRTRSNAKTAKTLIGKWGKSSYSERQQKIEFKKEKKKFKNMKLKSKRRKEEIPQKKKTLFFEKKSVLRSHSHKYHDVSLYN
jgi:hypothetical protein